MVYVYVLIAVSIIFLFPQAYAQTTTINVNQTEPCFLNYTAGADLFENCGLQDDYLETILAPWEWVTGGWFTMILISVLIIIPYVKYHKAVYSLIAGTLALPSTYFLFPEEFLSFAILIVGVLFGILIWYILIRQTKEFD